MAMRLGDTESLGERVSAQPLGLVQPKEDITTSEDETLKKEGS